MNVAMEEWQLTIYDRGSFWLLLRLWLRLLRLLGILQICDGFVDVVIVVPKGIMDLFIGDLKLASKYASHFDSAFVHLALVVLCELVCASLVIIIVVIGEIVFVITDSFDSMYRHRGFACL